ncbi:MAG TPA: FkbM family methyltransferase [Verrucomicrobiae bacterium]|jgi:FkbM family methyltransferase|nr:FkbM family methyltransferase [Verrucomicrobiae bacterium]
MSLLERGVHGQQADLTYREPAPAPLWANALAGVLRRMPAGKYRVIHHLCHGRNREFVGRMPRDLGGYKVHCSLRDHIACSAFFAGCYEAQESAFVRGWLRPGMSFVDTGANWGLFSLLAASLVGPSGRVISLEPDPRVFLKLKSNIERNQLKQVEPIRVAAADREAEVLLAGHDGVNQNSGMSRLVESGGASPLTFAVRSRRLDSLLDERGMDTIDLLKMDVEGAEHMALAGMEDGLKRLRYRCILLELHPLHPGETRPALREITGILLAKGYKGWALDFSFATTTRASHDPLRDFRTYLRPLEHTFSDPWPHTVWLAPGQPDLI